MIEAVKGWLKKEIQPFMDADRDFDRAEELERQLNNGQLDAEALEEFSRVNATRVHIYRTGSAALYGTGSAMLFGASRVDNKLVRAGLVMGGFSLIALGSAQGLMGSACVLSEIAVREKALNGKREL